MVNNESTTNIILDNQQGEHEKKAVMEKEIQKSEDMGASQNFDAERVTLNSHQEQPPLVKRLSPEKETVEAEDSPGKKQRVNGNSGELVTQSEESSESLKTPESRESPASLKFTKAAEPCEEEEEEEEEEAPEENNNEIDEPSEWMTDTDELDDVYRSTTDEERLIIDALPEWLQNCYYVLNGVMNQPRGGYLRRDFLGAERSFAAHNQGEGNEEEAPIIFLDTIRDRILRNKYASLEEFKDDVASLLNYHLRHPIDDEHQAIHEATIMRFEEELELLFETPMELVDRFEVAEANSPPSVNGMFDESSDFDLHAEAEISRNDIPNHHDVTLESTY